MTLQTQLDVGGLVIFAPGIYDTDTLTVRPGTTLLADGVTLRQTSDAGGHHTVLIQGDDITIRGLTLTGAGTVSGNTYGIAVGNLGNVARLHIERVKGSGYSAGVVQFGAPGGLVTDSRIIGLTCIDNGVNIAQPTGIAITNAKGVTISEFFIEHSGTDRSYSSANYAIDCEPNTDQDVVQFVTIANGVIRNTGYGGIQSLSRATATKQTSDIVIHGVHIAGCLQDGILVGQNGHKGTTVSGCVIRDNGRFGVRFYGSDSRLVGSRVIDNNRAGSGSGHISIEANVADCVISGNRIGNVDNNGYGPAVIEQGGGSDRNLIEGNSIHNLIGSLGSVVLTGPNSKQVNNIS